MRAIPFLGAVLAASLCAVSARAAEVNVSRQWCGGGCSEGHDDTECICTYNSIFHPSTRQAWVKCEAVPCCDIQSAWCDLGYVNQDQCYPREAGHDGEAYEPLYCSVFTEHGEKTCEVPCGESGCFAHYYVPHLEIVNEEGPSYCTRSNETCDWWAPWTCFEPCTLEEQSPWDDGGSGLICG